MPSSQPLSHSVAKKKQPTNSAPKRGLLQCPTQMWPWNPIYKKVINSNQRVFVNTAVYQATFSGNTDINKTSVSKAAGFMELTY